METHYLPVFFSMPIIIVAAPIFLDNAIVFLHSVIFISGVVDIDSLSRGIIGRIFVVVGGVLELLDVVNRDLELLALFTKLLSLSGSVIVLLHELGIPFTR